MGLDASVRDKDNEYVSVGMCSYGGYALWRNSIADAKGIDLDEMEGYGGDIKWDDKPFPLVFNHSDCDGYYCVEQIEALRKEIELIKSLAIDNCNICEKFLKLCDAATKYNLPIEFH